MLAPVVALRLARAVVQEVEDEVWQVGWVPGPPVNGSGESDERENASTKLRFRQREIATRRQLRRGWRAGWKRAEIGAGWAEQKEFDPGRIFWILKSFPI